jgi:hypothetical protein
VGLAVIDLLQFVAGFFALKEEIEPDPEPETLFVSMTISVPEHLLNAEPSDIHSPSDRADGER